MRRSVLFQEFVLFLFSYVIIVIWIFFQVTVAVLLRAFSGSKVPLLEVTLQSLHFCAHDVQVGSVVT